MPSPSEALKSIAAARSRDPLAPVTLIAPSRVAALHLRRRLAVEHGAFAGVRVEVLPRIAELLAAPVLAQRFDGPLARPIGDYLAAQLAREARSDLREVSDLPGFARALRQSFARLRRGGFSRSETLRPSLDSGLLAEVVRLYAEFRRRSERFYDDQDLYEAAAAVLRDRGAEAGGELGSIYVVQPGAQSAGADIMLRALRRAVGPSRFQLLDEPVTAPTTGFILAPDPASEVREVVREVLTAIEAGAGLHEVAVFHGADQSYRALLSQAFAAAGIPCVPMPGTPLSETAAGRGVLELAELPVKHYARTAVFDWLNLAPVHASIVAQSTRWRRLAAEAGITRGRALWEPRLAALNEGFAERAASDPDHREGLERRAADARALQQFFNVLIADLEPLHSWTRAAAFIESFRAMVGRYLRPDAPGMPAVLEQIDQLGTIDKLEGATFSLDSFVAALRANLDAAFHRGAQLGDGVLVADYRQAAGLSFKHVVLCGAYEGVFPAGAPQEPLVEDRFWTEMRAGHPFLEDAAVVAARSREAALRAGAAATERLTWSAPLQAAGAGRDHYPSQLMLDAARKLDPAMTSATRLRRASASAWLRKPASPLAAMLSGPAIDVTEARLRAAIGARRDSRGLTAQHPLTGALRLLRARRGAEFSEYDGNLAALAGDDLVPHSSVSPTSLEHYAACGMRYFLNAVLRLRPPEEPEDRDTLDPRDKGTLVHEVLDRFFRERMDEGRPGFGEAWNDADRARALVLLEAQLDTARRGGRTGLDVFAEHQRRRLRADLLTFLEKDSEFRIENGARPYALEFRIPETDFAGIALRGIADRIDKTPDGRKAWVIDYKTGSKGSYEGISDADPLGGGTHLQLPVYLAAVSDVDEPRAFYWFISSAGEFQRLEYQATLANQALFQATLAAILAGVRAGAFPANPGDEDFYGFKNCSYCDFKRLCSVRRDDEFEAKHEAPEMAPWSNVTTTAKGNPA